MRRVDPAHDATDKIIAELEKKIAKEFKQANHEVIDKLNKYLSAFTWKDSIWRKWVREEKRTQEAYDKWRKSQLIMGNRWAALKDELATIYANAFAEATRTAQGATLDVYALNHDYATFDVESQALRDTQYTLFSREAAAEMLSKDPDFYHAPGQTTRDAIASGMVKAWNKEQIQSVMTQGILQGESMPKLAKRLEKVTKSDHAAAIRDTRTMMTSVQNKGREDAYERAEKLGIEMERMWLAAHDERTRYWHRQLDYVTSPVNGYWENEKGKIRYPGDPQASGANIYNCRCRTRAVVKGLERKAYKLASDKKLGNMTYEEWRNSRKSKSNPLTLPEEKAAAIKYKYIKEYKGE